MCVSSPCLDVTTYFCSESMCVSSPCLDVTTYFCSESMCVSSPCLNVTSYLLLALETSFKTCFVCGATCFE